jgi:hypothetical protein
MFDTKIIVNVLIALAVYNIAIAPMLEKAGIGTFEEDEDLM